MEEGKQFIASRRRILAGSAALGSVALAGCADEEAPEAGEEGGASDTEDGSSDDGEEPAAASVMMLVEGVGGGHDHDHDDDHHDDDHDDDHHDDDHDDDHHDDDGLSQALIDEACGHMEFDEPRDLEGSDSPDEAPPIEATHQPFDVLVHGDSAFVVWDADAYADGDHDDHDDDHDDEHHDDDHDDDHDDHHDDEHHDDHDHDDGGDVDTFAFFTSGGTALIHEGHEEDTGVVDDCSAVENYVIAEPDHGRVVLELTPAE